MKAVILAGGLEKIAKKHHINQNLWLTWNANSAYHEELFFAELMNLLSVLVIRA